MVIISAAKVVVLVAVVGAVLVTVSLVLQKDVLMVALVLQEVCSSSSSAGTASMYILND